MAEISIGVGSSGRSFEGELQDWVQEEIARLAGITVMAIEEEMDAIYNRMQLSWPVDAREERDTVVSRDEFFKGLRISADLDYIEGFIGFNAAKAPYIPYIKSKKVGGKSPLQVLVRLPMLRARERLIAKLPQEFEDFSMQAFK